QVSQSVGGGIALLAVAVRGGTRRRDRKWAGPASTRRAPGQTRTLSGSPRSFARSVGWVAQTYHPIDATASRFATKVSQTPHAPNAHWAPSASAATTTPSSTIAVI